MIFCHYPVANLGDFCSCPQRYYPEWRHHPVTFLYQGGAFEIGMTQGPIVIGGGGILIDGVSNYYQQLASLKRPMVFWGGGLNSQQLTVELTAPLKHFELVGLRDFGFTAPWLPCSSCLHPALSLRKAPEHDYVIYEHYLNPIPIDGPRANNAARSLSQISAFLSRGKTVVTNSYHGAYWAMLLNRRVVLFKPDGIRFSYFRNAPDCCDEHNWKSQLKGDTQEESNFLDECRQLNADFGERVGQLE